MILVLDEDPEFRRDVADGLRRRGHRVAESTTCDPDLATVGTAVAAAVVGGAAENCLGLADRLHALFPGAAVVIATSQSELAARPEVHARDFVYCFCKPLTPAALSGIVDVLLPAGAPAAGGSTRTARAA